jgi:sec-independent protein translocase protein TatA
VKEGMIMHLGAQEIIIILLLVLLLFGGKKVSGLGRALGTSLREFKEEINKTDNAEKADVVKSETKEATDQKTEIKENK